jgi:predicted RNA-binding protein with PUA-like domain
MQYFLAKTDPETYNLATLESEGTTVWDGVTNPQAVQAIRTMRTGDRVFVYHSGGQSAIVGLARVASDARTDPQNPKSAVVDLQFICRLEPSTTLLEIKTSGLFREWSLVRNSRLSTMQAPAEFVAWMKQRYPKAKI